MDLDISTLKFVYALIMERADYYTARRNSPNDIIAIPMEFRRQAMEEMAGILEDIITETEQT